eukprot:2608502-Pleurochrysis_carterae.AAC.2
MRASAVRKNEQQLRKASVQERCTRCSKGGDAYVVRAWRCALAEALQRPIADEVALHADQD